MCVIASKSSPPKSRSPFQFREPGRASMLPFCLVRRRIAGLITVVASLLTGGCFPLGTIESDVPEEVDSAVVQLNKGVTQAEVREILGSPYFQNEPLRIEAYRKSGSDYRGMWAIVMPVWEAVDRHAYHFFIAYDERWKVLDWQVGAGSGRVEVADFVLVAASNRIGPFVQHTRPEVLLATKQMSQEALSKPPRPGTCALVLLSDPSAMERVLVDGVELVDHGWATRWKRLSDTFSRHEVDAGEHALEVAQQSVSGRFRQKFSCSSGTFTFVRLEAQIIPDFWTLWGFAQEGQIVITTEPPPNTNELRQILANGDDWYGFPENHYAIAADHRANAPDPGTKSREP